MSDFEYCLIEEAGSAICTVQMSTAIIAIVIVCNILKIGCYSLALLQKNFSPLVTLGDAIASFFHRPDKNTYLLGPITAIDVPLQYTAARYPHCDAVVQVIAQYYGSGIPSPSYTPIACRSAALNQRRFAKRLFWFAGASQRQWLLTYILYARKPERCVMLSTDNIQMLISMGWPGKYLLFLSNDHRAWIHQSSRHQSINFAGPRISR